MPLLRHPGTDPAAQRPGAERPELDHHCERSQRLPVRTLSARRRLREGEAFLRGGACPFRYWERLVRAVEEFNGHEDHFLVTKVFEIVDLVLPEAIALVPGFARLVGVFDRGAVLEVLAPTSAGYGGPEVIQHVAMKPQPLAGSKPDDPHPDTFVLRQQGRPHAAVMVLLFTLELGRNCGGPRRRVGAIGGLFQHAQGHSVPPEIVVTI